jgi:hypothetical protein
MSTVFGSLIYKKRGKNLCPTFPTIIFETQGLRRKFFFKSKAALAALPKFISLVFPFFKFILIFIFSLLWRVSKKNQKKKTHLSTCHISSILSLSSLYIYKFIIANKSCVHITIVMHFSITRNTLLIKFSKKEKKVFLEFLSFTPLWRFD